MEIHRYEYGELGSGRAPGDRRQYRPRLRGWVFHRASPARKVADSGDSAHVAMAYYIRTAIIASTLTLATLTLAAQSPPPLDDALRAIFERNEFAAQSVGETAWFDGGRRYTAVRPGTRDLV